MDPGPDVAWALARPGRSHAQVRGEVAALLRFVDDVWSAHFPVRQGYLTLTEPVDGPVGGVRLRVIRGDFRAQVALRCEEGRAFGGAEALSIMVRGQAHSHGLAELDDRARRLSARLRVAGGVVGTGVLGALGWPILVGADHPALATMFCFVLLGLLPLGGLSVGAYVAERITAAARARRLAADSVDGPLQTDFRRWHALARQLTLQRRAVTRGARGGPFRREPAPVVR